MAFTSTKNGDRRIDAGQYDFLQPYTSGWLGKIEAARKARKGFDDVARQCNSFFAGSVDFMWSPEFKAKYIKGNISPKFRITLQKAFEFVALYGPNLYWQTRRE